MFSASQYEEAIQASQKYYTDIWEALEYINTCADACVANMEGDIIAEQSGNELGNKIKKVEVILEEDLKKLIEEMKAEYERAQEIAKYNSDN